MRTALPCTAAVVLTLLVPTLGRGQGIGLPPFYDLAPPGGNTLQLEAGASHAHAAAYAASVGLRFRHEARAVGLLAGAALLGDGRFGYAAALSAQLHPLRTYLRDDPEHPWTAAVAPIADVNLRSTDALGRAYTGSLGVALALSPELAGFAVDLVATPRLELRHLAAAGGRDQALLGVQTGAAVGIARFIQLVLAADWTREALRPPDHGGARGGWTLGASMRARLPGTP